MLECRDRKVHVNQSPQEGWKESCQLFSCVAQEQHSKLESGSMSKWITISHWWERLDQSDSLMSSWWSVMILLHVSVLAVSSCCLILLQNINIFLKLSLFFLESISMILILLSLFFSHLFCIQKHHFILLRQSHRRHRGIISRFPSCHRWKCATFDCKYIDCISDDAIINQFEPFSFLFWLFLHFSEGCEIRFLPSGSEGKQDDVQFNKHSLTLCTSLNFNGEAWDKNNKIN